MKHRIPLHRLGPPSRGRQALRRRPHRRDAWRPVRTSGPWRAPRPQLPVAAVPWPLSGSRPLLLQPFTAGEPRLVAIRGNGSGIRGGGPLWPFFGVLGLLRFPDLLVVVPLKILALAQMYFCFVLGRMWHRVEAEALASVFGHTVPSASSASTAVQIPGSPYTMQPSHLASFPLLGWLVAVVSWYRRQ